MERVMEFVGPSNFKLFIVEKNTINYFDIVCDKW